MKNKLKKGNKQKRLLGKFTAVMIVVVLAASVFLYFQMKQYEKGLLDVCATGQDGYVQLVLDQINLNQNRDDEEIITDILGTLDASSNKYWTFSKDQAMLFVKDVTETNKYKGFTTSTYYVSDSAKDFLNNLKLNRVSHSEIEIEGKNYIASGVVFEYNSNEYRLCLLTNRDVFLENNTFLGAKSELITLIGAVLVMLLLVPTFAVRKLQQETDRAEDAEDTVRELNNKIIELNDQLNDKYFYDTKNSVWAIDALPTFVEKLKERKVSPVTAVHISCRDEEHRLEFLNSSAITLDKNVLRYECKDSGLLFLMIQIDKAAAMEALRPVIAGASLKKIVEYKYAEEISAEEIIEMCNGDEQKLY